MIGIEKLKKNNMYLTDSTMKASSINQTNLLAGTVAHAIQTI